MKQFKFSPNFLLKKQEFIKLKDIIESSVYTDLRTLEQDSFLQEEQELPANYGIKARIPEELDQKELIEFIETDYKTHWLYLRSVSKSKICNSAVEDEKVRAVIEHQMDSFPIWKLIKIRFSSQGRNRIINAIAKNKKESETFSCIMEKQFPGWIELESMKEMQILRTLHPLTIEEIVRTELEIKNNFLKQDGQEQEILTALIQCRYIDIIWTQQEPRYQISSIEDQTGEIFSSLRKKALIQQEEKQLQRNVKEKIQNIKHSMKISKDQSRELIHQAIQTQDRCDYQSVEYSDGELIEEIVNKSLQVEIQNIKQLCETAAGTVDFRSHKVRIMLGSRIWKQIQELELSKREDALAIQQRIFISNRIFQRFNQLKTFLQVRKCSLTEQQLELNRIIKNIEINIQKIQSETNKIAELYIEEKRENQEIEKEQIQEHIKLKEYSEELIQAGLVDIGIMVNDQEICLKIKKIINRMIEKNNQQNKDIIYQVEQNRQIKKQIEEFLVLRKNLKINLKEHTQSGRQSSNDEKEEIDDLKLKVKYLQRQLKHNDILITYQINVQNYIYYGKLKEFHRALLEFALNKLAWENTDKSNELEETEITQLKQLIEDMQSIKIN